MRPLLAVMLTVGLPAAAGFFAIRGPRDVRLSFGVVLGIATTMVGAVAGAAAGHVLIGATVALVSLVAVGRRWPTIVIAPSLDRTRTIALAIVLIAGLAIIVMAFYRPVSYWDGWAIWSLKARALTTHAGLDHAVFTHPAYAFARQDYPIALPAWQATAYEVAGTVRVSWPLQVQLAALFTAGSYLIVRVIGTFWWSAMVTAAFVLAPAVLNQSLYGYADVPLLVIGLVAAWQVTRGHQPWTPAILMAATASLKTEGMLFAAAICAISLLFDRQRQAAISLAVVGVTSGFWIAVRRAHGLESELLTPESLNAGRALDLLDQRAGVILRSTINQLLTPRDVGVAVAFLVVALLVARRAERTYGLSAVATATVIAAAYLVTPFDVQWQLDHSVDRVILMPLGLAALAVADGRRPTGVSSRARALAGGGGHP